MTIHYIWIGNHNNILAQPITLSSKFIFKTEIKKSSKKGKITITSNPSYIENFFKKNNVKEVSAIIGKNGSGKTSILEFIKSNFPEGVSSRVTDNTIIIYSNIENEKEVLYVVKPDSWNIEVINETNFLCKDKDYSNGDNVSEKFMFSSGLSYMEFFYYNFFLDYKYDVANWSGLKDISTSTLLCMPRKSAIEERWNKYEVDYKEAVSFDLTFFMRDELSKAIQLITSKHKKLIPFTIPKTLFISISETDKIYFKSDNDSKGNKELNEQVNNIIKQVGEINRNSTLNNQVLNNLYLSILLNFLVSHFYYSSPVIRFKYDLKFNPNISIKDFVLNFFEKLSKTKLNFNKHKEIESANFRRLGQAVPSFIAQIERFVEEGVITFQENNNKVFKLPMSQKADKDFNAFMNVYMQIKGLTNFLEFSWRSLSTGQQSFLSFMSRFYHEKHHAVGSDQLKKKLFIMIDEGDAGFHPEWQKKFFNNSLNFLADLFSDSEIQIVYTANSPYLISDLTKNHIIFIENKENKIIVYEKENNREETFGQNIHTLLSNSFFLETGLIGEFARDKINEVISILKLETPTDNEIMYASKIIQMIGEPVLKRKLSLMFEENFTIPIDIKGEIEQTENRLKRLKSLLNNDTNTKGF